jgi:hypothetical protein
MSKLSRVLLIVLAGVLVSPAIAWAQGRCHKHWDRHSHKWTTHCARSASPAAAPAGSHEAPSAAASGEPANTDPTDRYWYDPED